MAADRLERLARDVGVGLVIARDDPDLPPSFESHLCRAQDMTGRVQRNPDAIDFEWLAVGQSFRSSQSASRRVRVTNNAITSHQISAASAAKMVGMRVRHDGAVNRTPGVDEKAPLFAVEPDVGDSKQWVFVQVHAVIIDTSQGRRSSHLSFYRMAPASSRSKLTCRFRDKSAPLNTDLLRPVATAATAPAIAATTTAAAAVAATTTATIFTWLCLVDRQPASAMLLVVKGVDSRKSIGVRRHLDKAEATTPARLAILDHLGASHLAKRRKQIFQVGIRDREREIADIQLLAHLQTPRDLGCATLTRIRLSGSKERGRTGRPTGQARRIEVKSICSHTRRRGTARARSTNRASKILTDVRREMVQFLALNRVNRGFLSLRAVLP